MLPGQTNVSMDSAWIRNVTGGILGCVTFQGFVANGLTGPVVSAIIILINLVFAAGAAKFSIEFRRNKPNEIIGFATLGLSWFALVCCVAMVLWSLYQSFASPTLLGIVPLLSGVVLCSAPVTVLCFSARSWVLNKAKSGVAERREYEGPHQ